MAERKHPLLYQINTRVYLTELSRKFDCRATLDDIPDEDLDQIVDWGFDWVWMLTVWQIGDAGREESRRNPIWRKAFQETLTDLTEDDICGSGFAVRSYKAAEDMGGTEALRRLRVRLKDRGLKLMLDFVPNHMGLGHDWIHEHPDYFIRGSESDLLHKPQNYVLVETNAGEKIFAHGRDPFFDGWSDTLQIDYSNPESQTAMKAALSSIAHECDGVRCDMAMLLLPDVFERTWGVKSQPFWPDAIAKTKNENPDFRFMAEVYWDLEFELQQQGFDYTYDKRLYDRLRHRESRPVREHLCADLDFQDKSVRFLENHDEPRAAHTFTFDEHKAAAAISYFCPGLRFFYRGQLEGRKIHVPPHLNRAPDEPFNEGIFQYYEQILHILKHPLVHEGRWRLLDARPAWDNNWTWDNFIISAWEDTNGNRLVVAVNFSNCQSQCYVSLPFEGLAGTRWQLTDPVHDELYERYGEDLSGSGLYLDMQPWETGFYFLYKV